METDIRDVEFRRRRIYTVGKWTDEMGGLGEGVAGELYAGNESPAKKEEVKAS